MKGTHVVESLSWLRAMHYKVNPVCPTRVQNSGHREEEGGKGVLTELDTLLNGLNFKVSSRWWW